MTHPITRLAWVPALLVLSLGHPAHAEKLNLPQMPTPACPALYAPDAADPSKCTFVPPADAAACKPQPDFTVVSGACVPKFPVVAPTCPGIHSYTAKVLSDTAGQLSCVYERPDAPTSSQGDYVGDCFHLKTPVGNLAAGTRLFVTDQDAQDKASPMLTVVRAVNWGDDLGGFFQDLVPGWPGCRATVSNTPATAVSATELTKSGATRRGYAFGALTMPYKYFPGSKKFIEGVPLGAYLGWRVGQPGSALTFAASVTLGSVSADTVTRTGTGASEVVTITGSTQAAALSWAGGLMVDVSRNPASKPFRAGFFVGKDHVNRSDNISYEHNNKTWVAVQIGFDFTDY
jgi:hypothetical protein